MHGSWTHTGEARRHVNAGGIWVTSGSAVWLKCGEHIGEGMQTKRWVATSQHGLDLALLGIEAKDSAE